MKIYLAGPDVFRPDAESWAQAAKTLCARYGYKSLTPLDHRETTAEGIFKANIELIKKAQIVVANLDPFRGAEPDSGTVFELGYAHALGKKICAYLMSPASTVARVEAFEGRPSRINKGRRVDSTGWAIEDFAMPVNLMIGVPALIVTGDLEACLSALRQHSLAKGA